MTKKVALALILIGSLCLESNYPGIQAKNVDFSSNTKQIINTEVTESTESLSDNSIASNNKLLQQTVENWATAFCNRDGNTLYQLFDPDKKDDFYQLKYVNSTKGDSEILFGFSSPWPWETDYRIDIQEDTATITYYAMTSEPHVYAWVEKLKLVQKNGLYYISSEELKTYDSITSRQELEDSLDGNFYYYSNKLNYINAGLAYTLNQNAENDSAGIYYDLFSAETAAPYLLNLSGGKCSVKKKFLTCTVVTYTFANGGSIDILMTQPFGQKGIWLVEDVLFDDYDYTDIKDIESWYKKLNINKLNKIKKVASVNDIVEAKEGTTLLLASIPEEKVYMYGYAGGDGVILRVNDKYQLFRWIYIAPRAVQPQLSYGDFDQDGKKEIAVTLYTGTGTGVSVHQLYIVEVQNDGTLTALEYTPYQYIKQMMEKVIATYSQTDHRLQFYIDGQKSGNAIDLSSWVEDGYQYSEITFGDQISFDVSKNAITLEFIPGYCFDNVAPPQYDHVPDFSAKVIYNNGEFSLTDIKIVGE